MPTNSLKLITHSQLKKLHVLLNQAKMMDDKKMIVRQYSAGRTESSRELTKVEALKLIKSLEGESTSQISKDRMAKKILSMAHEIGWKKDGKIDMDRLNAWCEKSGYLHKKLNDYTYNELPKLVSQFERMYVGYVKAPAQKKNEEIAPF